MQPLLFVATALLSVISANRVIHLNADNFDSIVDGTRNVFVKFEAAWCGPCKRMAPIMSAVAAESFPNLDGDTILANIDADEHREIGDRFDIKAFPTIKLFLKGRDFEDAVEFQGDRSPENISKFIKAQVAINQASLADELKQLKPAMPLTQLLQELAKAPARPQGQGLKNYVVNMNNFASGFMDASDDSDGYYKSDTPAQKQQQQQQKNLQQKKVKTRKDKGRSRKQTRYAPAVNELPLVDENEAKAIIKTAGSKPVILIFFSPSKTIFFSFFVLFFYCRLSPLQRIHSPSSKVLGNPI